MWRSQCLLSHRSKNWTPHHPPSPERVKLIFVILLSLQECGPYYQLLAKWERVRWGMGQTLVTAAYNSCSPAVLFVAIPDDWCHAGGWHLVHEAARWQTVIVSCFARYDSMTFLCKETLFDGSL